VAGLACAPGRVAGVDTGKGAEIPGSRACAFGFFFILGFLPLVWCGFVASERNEPIVVRVASIALFSVLAATAIVVAASLVLAIMARYGIYRKMLAALADHIIDSLK
jgi:hypothetical protein